MNKVMIDLETMGKGANAAIIAIGAVRFDEDKVCDKFYEIVDLQSSVEAGLDIDASTVYFWLKQGDAARQELTAKAHSLEIVLSGFAGWLGDDAEIWGNGAAFDNVILSNAYAKTGIKQPWKFTNDRCYRTLKNLFPEITLERKGTYHCAVDDAETQANHLIQILKAMHEGKAK